MALLPIPNLPPNISSGTPVDLNALAASGGVGKTSALTKTEDTKDKMLDAFRRGYIFPRKGTSTIDDPTFLGFTIMFDFEGSKLFRGHQQVNPDGTVQGNLPTTECAFSYLNAIGETVRMSYLKAFIDQLIYINTNKPFFWQSIEGLDTLWTDFNDFKKMPIASSWEIDIKTLESVDLKIFGLMELYRKAVFDYDHTRQIVPSNLQRFNMTIYINEIRTVRPVDYKMGSKGITGDTNIHGKIDLLAALGLNDPFGSLNFDNIMNRFKAKDAEDLTSNKDESITDLINWLNGDEHGIIVGFSGCKFFPVGGGELLQSVSNNAVTMATNNLKIKAKSASIASALAWYEERIDSNTTDSNLRDNKLWDSVKNRTKNLLKNAAAEIVEKQKRNLKTKIGNLIRDNVPAAFMGTLEELRRGNFIGALFQATGLNLNGGLGDVYPGETQTATPRNPENLGDVYPQQLGITSNASPNNLGDVYPQELETTSTSEVNDLGGVHQNDDLGFVSTTNVNDLGTVHPDLQNFLIQQNLDQLDRERELSNSTVYEADDIPNNQNNEEDASKPVDLGSVHPNLENFLIQQRLEGQENASQLGGLDVYPEV
jgi:hypothetical protein